MAMALPRPYEKPEESPDARLVVDAARGSPDTIEWGHATQGAALARVVAELYPGTARAHTTLGVLLAETGDEKGTAAAYARALEVDGRETRALEWRRRL